MFGIGMPELIVILVIIMIIFGAGKLPEIGGGLGKAIRNFKTSMSDPEKKDEKGEEDEEELLHPAVVRFYDQPPDQRSEDRDRNVLVDTENLEAGGDPGELGCGGGQIGNEQHAHRD